MREVFAWLSIDAPAGEAVYGSECHRGLLFAEAGPLRGQRGIGVAVPMTRIRARNRDRDR